MRELNIEAATHGRILIDDASDAGDCRILAGFHGYGMSADEHLTWLQGIPGSRTWTRVAIQGLHRFYQPRTQQTVASWMTRQDRALLIADNIRYVDDAITAAADGRQVARLVVCGFSQGVAMAFRAGLLGARAADGIIAVGGDVPPELLADAAYVFPHVVLARGVKDGLLTAGQHRRDTDALISRARSLDAMTYEGGHEWHADVAAAAGRLLSRL